MIDLEQELEMHKEIIEAFQNEEGIEIIKHPSITQDIEQYFYEDRNGNIKFGGNFLKGADKENKLNKLTGTTSIINVLFPFGDMISPILIPWLAKLDSKEPSNPDDLFSSISKYQEGIQFANQLLPIQQEATMQTINDGNYAEEVTYHLLTNNGSLNGLDEYIQSINDKPETVDRLIKSDRAIKFGELCYEQIMKLGTNVKLVDYQTKFADTTLFDVGFADFVVEADGKLILIDMKTGSRVSRSKLEKVRFQLLGSYKKKFKGVFGKNPDRILVITGVEDKIEITKGLKKWKTFGETIDITNDDENGYYKQAYEMTANLVRLLYTSGIWKLNKQENKVML